MRGFEITQFKVLYDKLCCNAYCVEGLQLLIFILCVQHVDFLKIYVLWYVIAPERNKKYHSAQEKPEAEKSMQVGLI
jgi:hypothetical protein